MGKNTKKIYNATSQHKIHQISNCKKPQKICNCRLSSKDKEQSLELLLDSVEVQPAEEKGEGTFAIKMIPKGSRICEYEGQLIKDPKIKGERWPPNIENWTSEGNFSFFFKTADGRKWCIDANASSGPGRKINHSKREQNVKPVVDESGEWPKVCFVAVRDIEPGQELFYDYQENERETVRQNPWLAL